MPALLFSLQLGEAVWGTGLLEEPGPGQHGQHGQEAEEEAAEAQAGTLQSVMLRAPHPGFGTEGADVAHLTPQPRGEIRGALQLRAEWSEKGAKLQLHSVKSVTISVARLYELKVAEGAPGDGQSGWLLQIWGSPSAAEMTQCIPFCRMGLRCDSPVPFTSNLLYIERPVDLHWPETWTSKGSSKISEIGHGSYKGTIAARCRHAMFQGTAPDSVTARSLKHWADLESWFLFGPIYSRYDDELLPIDEATALHPDGEMALVPEALQELRDDPDYIACHASVVRFILLSWGWDAESGELVKDTHAGQGWAASGQHAWRLRHLCLSCWLLGQAELRQSCNDFVLMLGSKAPWTEDGMGEAKFTLARNGDAAVDAFWDARLPPSCSSRDERTLWGILCAADHVVDRPVTT
ncbi:hypothetical protein AK812_SmicGene7330 [Symbiodinium microadriaticum]|uniref:Uncharacterized protein n=1 Tax=Symbiodinium microadriaticum TaxID=2951 RepID=A0A1Q9ENV8_SYMMI|nr:hypothetical protein AK812_SmicGene7330 [Symbiodinium microadriaticum]CAE7779047.1 unnamed protein product [Symbiodinium sp. KB8]